jgi:hypothetical protein
LTVQTWSRGRLGLSFVTLRHEEIDWSGLRAAAVAIGIRPAARQAALHLPPDERERFVQRAMKRCSREKWLVKCQQDKADAVVMSPTALSANVRKGADVLSEILAEDSRETRIGLSAAARKAAETFAKMPGAKGYQARPGPSAHDSKFKRTAQLGRQRQPNTVHAERAQH